MQIPAQVGRCWGISQPETVAEHPFRVGLFGIALAAMEGADPGRTAALCLIQALRTESVTQLAQAIVTYDSRGWWVSFVSSYHELRAVTRTCQGR